jgi:hypothetical protein
MSTWTSNELGRIGAAEELQLASLRHDGTLRPYVTMWVVRAGDDLYVRSAYGPDNPWFRRAKTSGAGRIRAGSCRSSGIPARSTGCGPSMRSRRREHGGRSGAGQPGEIMTE